MRAPPSKRRSTFWRGVEPQTVGNFEIDHMPFSLLSYLPSYAVAPLLAGGGLLAFARWAKPESPRARRLITLLLALLVVRYHFWRITQTLPAFALSAAALSIYAFYALELSAAYLDLKSRSMLIESTDRARDVKRDLRWYGSSEDAPLIDILIPTYNENRRILRTTIIAASRQDYARFRVWVLDDGQRDWVAKLCEELGVHYLTREDRVHFKAGNLNHALQHLLTRGDAPPQHLAVLDADFVAYPTFLQHTLALMREPRVAIVQTPQCFYNADPFQYAFRAQAVWPDEWRANSVLLSSLDAKGFASCYGTSFLLRVDAIRELGRFPTDALLEDWLLSIELGRMGWRTIYLNECLSVGLSPEGLGELRRQRARWFLGQVQVGAQLYRSLGRALALGPRLRLFRSLLGGFVDPVLRLTWPALPVIYWFTGFAIVRASTTDVVSYCLPLLALHGAMFWLTRGASMPITSQAEKLILAPLRIRCGIMGLSESRAPKFDVTPKGIERPRTIVHGATMSWLGLTAFALAGGMLYRLIFPWASASTNEFLAWNLAATCLLLPVLVIAMVPCVERPKHRRTERYPDGRRITIVHRDSLVPCQLIDLSIEGARAALPESMQVGDTVTLQLAGGLMVEGRIVRRGASGESGIEFFPTLEQEAKIIQMVLCSKLYVPQPERWSWWKLAGAVVRRAWA